MYTGGPYATAILFFVNSPLFIVNIGQEEVKRSLRNNLDDALGGSDFCFSIVFLGFSGRHIQLVFDELVCLHDSWNERSNWDSL